MNRIPLRIIIAATAGFMLFGAKSALAVNEICDGVPTGSPGNGECQVTALHSSLSGVYAVDRALHIIGPLGELRATPGAPLTLQIAGNTVSPFDGLIMDSGAKITGDSASGSAAASTIIITVATGDVTLSPTAFITADNTKGGGCGAGSAGVITLTANGVGAKITTTDGTVISASGLNATKTGLGTCSAGAINISAPNSGVIDIDGKVLSESGRSGSGNALNVPRGGGPISVEAACDLTVSRTGKVSSFGLDPGADLVHLRGGCDVLIEGLVRSTGVGHGYPRANGIPSNLCQSTVAGSPHFDKPVNSTGCVEVWAGTIVITSTGEINADTGGAGGSSGTSWIDLFANNGIQVSAAPGKAAVHANGNAGTNDNGGVVTVKSTNGSIGLSGLALQANALGNGGRGGVLDVEAGANGVDLSNGLLQAMGAPGGGGGQHGGRIIVYSQSLPIGIAANATTNLNVSGRTPSDGVITLQACGTIAFGPGTTTGALGINLTISPSSCPAPLSFPEYAKVPTVCPCDDLRCGPF